MEVFCLVRADEGCTAQPRSSRSACWRGLQVSALFLLERGYIQVKHSVCRTVSRRLNGDLAKMGREGLALKYLRQGGGQK